MSDTGTAAATTTTTTTDNAPWFNGADPETVGYIQNRGLDKVTPVEAAMKTIKAHREAEKHLGVPSDQLIRMPKDAGDADGWNGLYNRLGVPADASGYDFSGVKFADGTELDADFKTAIGTALRSAGVAKDKAGTVVKALVELGDKETAADSAASRDLIIQEMASLKIDWGSNIERNMIVADNAAAELGMTPEEINTMKEGMGAAKVAKIFFKLGQSMGEDRFVSGGQKGDNRPMSGEMAEARIAEMQTDTEFMKRFMAGDTAAKKELDNVSRMVAEFKRATGRM